MLHGLGSLMGHESVLEASHRLSPCSRQGEAFRLGLRSGQLANSRAATVISRAFRQDARNCVARSKMCGDNTNRGEAAADPQ